MDLKTYKYTAKDLKGQIIKSSMSCENEDILREILRKKGYYLIKSSLKMKYNFKLTNGRLNKKELAIICKQFSIIIGSGINISEAIEILKQQIKNYNVKSAFDKIKNQIDAGEALSDSFKSQKDCFPTLMINMIVIGEDSGGLEDIFQELSKHFENEYLLSKDIRSALAYPIILSIVSIIVVLYLMISIIPSFSKILISMKQKLPPITKGIFETSRFLREKYFIVILLLALFLLIAMKVLKTEAGKNFKYKTLLRIPLVSRIYIKKIQLKIIRSMTIVLKSGDTVFRAIQLSTLSVDNTIVKSKLKNCTEETMKGTSTLESIKNTCIFDPIILSMISVGEETGKLREMLDKAGEILEEDVKEVIKTFVKLLEPVIIVIISIIIGIIIYSVLLPMMSIMENIK